MDRIDIFSRSNKNFFSINSSHKFPRKYSINKCILYLLYAGLGLAGLIFFYILFICLSYFFNRADLALEIEQYRKWVHGTNEFPKKPPIKIYASEGTLLGEYLPERGSWITLSACSNLKWLKEATIAVEDNEFYSHNGVSYRGILRAAWRNLRSFSVREGAGTITQQLARNLFTGRERSFYRKLYETLIAFQLEKQLNKKEIMCLYLNKIYMGEGRIGAEEAAWFYFRKPPWKLDAPEAAMIVGLFPSPLYYSPLNNIHLSLKKQSMVLDRLVESNVLSLKERNKAMRRFVKRYGIKLGLEADAGQVGQYGASRDFRLNIAPSVNEYVKKFLYKSIPEDVIQEGGLHVHTTIEPKRQAIALRIVRQEILSLRKKMLAKNRAIDAKKIKEWSDRLNGSLVSIDASSGNILSVVGGYTIIEGSMTQRVWSMLRQPGSSIKGFLYAVSLDEGQLNLDSLVVDEAINIAGYKPRNWNRKFLGEVELSRAVAMSINTVAVKTLHNLGVGTFRDRLRDVLQLGFFEERDRFPSNLSLALGSAEQTPLELARLYASITNGGYAVKPKLIDRVVDAKQQVLWQASSVSPLSESNLLSSQSCAKTLKLMESVFDPEKEGTAGFIGKRRNENPDYLPFPIAGKTGTVQIPKGVCSAEPRARLRLLGNRSLSSKKPNCKTSLRRSLNVPTPRLCKVLTATVLIDIATARESSTSPKNLRFQLRGL